MKKILTGLKPTGEVTLGNYIGAINQIVKLQDEYETYLFVADLHALTVYQDPKELHERIKRFIALYIACGINPDKCLIYLQSENPYIPAISFLLECTTYYGEASRMIQFKEKSKENKNFSVGLLTYPILMAADILYCDANLVPVGIDQKQHVELARDVAMRFNNKYGETFVLPEALIADFGVKIKDLKNPTKKMSKSEGNKDGVISMFDTADEIKRKIMHATTDSENVVKFDEENKPGISNLMNIVVNLEGISMDDITNKFIGKGYKEFKEYVADIVIKHLTAIQNRYNELINSKEIDNILDKGIKISKQLAKDKYLDMCQKMGIVR